MKYTVEDLAPCVKKIVVTVEAEEVNASINAALALKKDSFSLPGFRKGHVPAGIMEKRLKDQIYPQAANDLVNVHVNTILSETALVPVSSLDINPTPINLVRDENVEYTIQFECMPAVELPDYEGLEVEQTQVKGADDEQVDRFLHRLCTEREKTVPVEGNGPAEEGQYVNLDLQVLEDGHVLQDSKEQEYLVGQPLSADLDTLVKTLKIGETGEITTTFPEDFFNPALQNKTVQLRAHIHAINNRVPCTVDDLAKEFKLSDEAAVRHWAAEIVEAQLNNVYRSNAQNDLVEKMLKMVDFPLPPSLVEGEMGQVIQQEQNRAMRVGKALSDEQVAEIREKHREEVEHRVRSFVLLMAVARKENIDVAQQEVAIRLTQLANSIHVDPQMLYRHYESTGQIFVIRDQIMTEKASQAIYAKAKVTMVPAAEKKDEAAEAAPEAEAAQPEAAAEESK